MPRPVTESEVNQILRLPKNINTEIVWTEEPKDSGIFKFDVQVEIDYPCILSLIGTYNTKLNRFSFCLLYNRIARIRHLDIGKEHQNPPPKRERVGKKHKHVWKDRYADRWAYEPDDITTGAPIEQVFQEFLVECNITSSCGLPKLPPRQLELFRDDELLSTNRVS